MKGYFLLSYASSCNEDPQRISHDNYTKSLVKSVLGPHELYFLLEGIETTWIRQEYVGNCKYRFVFQLSIPASRHRLYVVQLRSDFWGFNEVDFTKFPDVDVQVIAQNVFIVLPWPTEFRRNDISLPLCNVDDRSGAAGFVSTPPPHFDNDPVVLTSDLPSPKFYVNLRMSSEAKWSFFTCQIDSITPVDFMLLTDGMKIDFVGDSHIRVLFNHILRTFCGVPQAAQKGWGESQCLGLGEMPQCPRLSACLIYSPYLDISGNEGHGSNRHALILNFGNHPASSAHWTLKQFSSRVNHIFSNFASLKIKVLWLGQSPIPFRTDDFVQRYSDTRTFSRLAVFDQTALCLAAPYVRNGSLVYVDIFALSMTAIQWSLDNSHLLGVDAALDGISNSILLHL